MTTAAVLVQMWEMCDDKLMDECLAPDVRVFHPVLGHTYTGLEEVCTAIGSPIDDPILCFTSWWLQSDPDMMHCVVALHLQL